MAESPTENDEPVFKRRRVSQACQTCRRMKSKCDGKRPKCARCVGYGFNCYYSAQGTRGEGASAPKNPSIVALDHLRDTVKQYESLIKQTLPQSSSTKDSAVDKREAQLLFSSTKVLVARAFNDLESILDDCGQSPRMTEEDPEPSLATPLRNQRYLGEVSDVRFFNVMKGLLQTKSPVISEREFDSYEQEGEAFADSKLVGQPVSLPNLDGSFKFVEVYFATIHLAYPFLPESVFIKRYYSAQNMSDHQRNISATDLALFYVIAAIGSYYTSFPDADSTSANLHDAYFRRAMTLASTSGNDRSINGISLLLAQCFYFLASCKTDSCWTALGKAVRIAQSIGLHVETSKSSPRSPLEIERRRRVWYCIYVLDRLLSLQLGRPAAIHDEDCNVPLPSRRADSDIDWNSDTIPPANEGPSGGDYFLAVIAFSRIVSHVLRDTYGVTREKTPTKDVLRTQTLDSQLSQWKMSLPRRLRFDLSHAFDQDVIFRRQRNMLAVKFHHLRALVHRPYLCYPLLLQFDDDCTVFPQTDWPLISHFEEICVSEARETARLLHNVLTVKDLVHEFPWWQMVSCLICAGTILLVSSISSQTTGDDTKSFENDCLRDDAETCLKMFEALGVNSRSASMARDMMEGLKHCTWNNQKEDHQAAGSLNRMPQSLNDPTTSLNTLPPPDTKRSDSYFTAIEGLDSTLSDGTAMSPSWPAEILDSMTWSSQMFYAFQGAKSGEL